MRLAKSGRCAGMIVTACAMLMMMTGCSDDREVLFDTTGSEKIDAERALVLDNIAKLAAGKNLADPDNVVTYHGAVDALIARGAAIETQLCEAVAGNDDWGVRLGAVEVLKAVGTRNCVETLLGALEDPQPLVALNADYLLRELTKYSVIPQENEPPKNNVPAVPKRDPNDLALDADERIWSEWHAENKVALHTAWEAWWRDNKDTITIK